MDGADYKGPRERPFRYHQCLHWNPYGIHYGSKGRSYTIFYPTFLFNVGLWI